MTGARVALIVPVWNDEENLPQSLDSLLAQTYGDWRAIVVDDASTDRTPEIASSYARRHPERFTYLRLEENLGSPGARRQALKELRDEELMVLHDSDDYLDERFLERLVGMYDEGVAAGRRMGIVSCNAWLHLPEGVTGETWADVRRWCDSPDLTRMLEYNYVFARALFSRAAYDEVGGSAPECSIRQGGQYASSDDHDLWLRIVEAGYEVAMTREPLAYYRLDPAGRSKSPALMAYVDIVVYQRALERGRLNRRQRRVARRWLRHYRALYARGLVTDALSEGRRLDAAGLALRAAPLGLVAFLQAPRRWGEWAGQALHLPGRPGLSAP